MKLSDNIFLKRPASKFSLSAAPKRKIAGA